MNTVQLKYFIAVAESGSFSEAAEIMYSGQSTVSKQIAALEKELGVLLFDRSKRQISLTEHGKVLLPHAQKIIKRYNNMLKDLKQVTTFNDNSAVIRTTMAMLSYNVLHHIAQFNAQAPWAKITIEEYDDHDISNMLRNDECDLAFFRIGEFDENLFEKITVLTDNYVAVLPADHPLAKEKSISLASLSSENFILCRPNSCIHTAAVNACHTVGFEPNVVATSNATLNIFEMVDMHLGVSLLLDKGTRHYIDKHLEYSVCIVPLKETFSVEIAFARYKKHNHTKASLAFWEYAKEQADT